MLDLQTNKHALEARLATPLPLPEISAIGLELQKIDGELADLEEKWLLVSEEIEAASD